MKSLPVIITLGSVTFLLLIRQLDHHVFRSVNPQMHSIDSVQATEILFSTVRAPAKIEGVTETVELQACISELVIAIEVESSDWVKQGDVLVSLDSAQLTQQLELAKAMLDVSLAEKDRLVNGARDSEIEEAKQAYESHLAPLWSAERELSRNETLLKENAVSQQAVDALRARAGTLKSAAAASLARLKTLELPARKDALAAADAKIRAERARLKIAEIALQHSQITAPFDGRILKVNAKLGELANPLNTTPLILMADTRKLFAVADIDEFDDLDVTVGQHCQITANNENRRIMHGRVVLIEPIMHQKKVFGQWSEERIDTFSRRVKIAIDDPPQLPIGLPVDVVIGRLQ